MTPKKILTSGVFCPMPWTGLMFNFDGKVKNCIRSSGILGNISENNIHDILNNDINKDTQERMLNDLPGKTCNTCYDLEHSKKSFDIVSDRVFYIRELKHVPMNTYRVGNHNLHTIDVRWTNLCNFACVYCNPLLSSKWAKELNVVPARPTNQQIEEFKNYIFDNARNLKHVYMAGGEPLLMKENLELLDLLLRVNPTVNLRVNTNLSKVNTHVFDRICEFQNVHWTVSVESQNEEFEYIRYGASWQEFSDNLEILRKLDHKISFNMLYFLLNFNSFFDCVEHFQSLGFHNNSFIVSALLRPDYLNVKHLPEYMLKSTILKLETWINQSPGYLLEDSLRNLKHYLEQPFTKNLPESFVQLNILDRRRKLDSSKIFTELYSLKQGNYHGQTV